MTSIFSLKNIEKSFGKGAGKTYALKDVTLELKAGELVCLRGPSGSGKSTLLNILGLLETSDGGDLVFKGSDVTKMLTRAVDGIRRKDIGFIFQNFNLSPILSAVENVEYPLFLLGGSSKKQIQDRAMEALAAVGMAEFKNRKPSELSGGQRQRVAIGRALVKNPSLILADEPTANLDQVNAGKIVEILGNLNQTFGSTVVIATHDEKISQMTRRVIYLQDGKIQWDK